MKEKGIHRDKVSQEIYGVRNLDTEFPAIKKYLSSGLKVLDVGCGPGTITVGVAEEVKPGSVTAIDAEESSLELARNHTKEMGVENVSFQVGDAYHLDFPDATFDLAYCRHILEWLVDPVKAIREMMQATKPGGHVAAHDHDVSGFIIYPACPTFARLSQRAIEIQNDENRHRYEDFHFGRKLFGFFRRAELKDIKVEEGVHNLTYAGADSFERYYNLLIKTADAGLTKVLTKKLLEEGLLEKSPSDAMRKKFENWYKHPDAFCMWAPGIFVAGKVQ